MRTVSSQLNCQEKGSRVIHLRNAGYIVRLCNKFPTTQIRIRRQAEPGATESEAVDATSIFELACAQLRHGEILAIEAEGKCEILACEFLKVALENLEGYSDNPEAVEARLTMLIDEAFLRTEDPGLNSPGSEDVIATLAAETKAADNCRAVATINDRLHNLSLPMLPLIAKHFDSALTILFEVQPEGIFQFQMNEANGYGLDYQTILKLPVEVGTRITVLTHGPNRFVASTAVTNVLTNLWQCDDWVRTFPRLLESDPGITELLQFAANLERRKSPEYASVYNPYISNLLTEEFVFVNGPNAEFSKEEVLAQLSAPHARKHNLDLKMLLNRVKDTEQKKPVILRPGFALAHGAVDRTPRIALSFGVYPKGVSWSETDRHIRLVCMVIVATDTYGTWRDYLKKLGILFRTYPGLQDQLVQSRDRGEFSLALRRSETAMTA